MWWACAALALAAADGGSDALRQVLALEQRGDDARALQAADDLVRANPNWELPRLEAARLRLKSGEDLDRAQLDLEAARTLAPENPRAQYLYGLLLQEQGDAPAAAHAFELALVYRPEYDDARARLAQILFSRGDWANAETHYRVLARAHPDDVNAGLQLAAALEKLKRLEDAEIEYRKLLDRFPDSPLVGRRLAEFYDRTGRPRLAARVRQQTDKAEPKKKMRALKKSAR